MVSRATRVTCHIYYHLQVEASDNEYYFETSLAHYFFHLVCVCVHICEVVLVIFIIPTALKCTPMRPRNQT